MKQARTAHIDNITAEKIKGYDHFVIDAFGQHLGTADRKPGTTDIELVNDICQLIYSVSSRDINICNMTVYLYKANKIVS